MNNHRWLGELELRCDSVAGKNNKRSVDHGSLEDRDRLITFANRLVEKRLVTRFDMLSMIDQVDQRLFGT